MTTSGSPVARLSRVAVTPPSTEFSMGTMPASMSPARTAASVESTESYAVGAVVDAAVVCASRPSQSSRAIWVKVPGGPK